jgi:hypothetical protein
MISVDEWLKSFGFVRNPFETTEAGSEARYATDFLHATFVKPRGFDQILGHPTHPKSSLIFASRGKGKSSTRLMTAHFCREGIFSIDEAQDTDEVGRVLPVHHTRFEDLFGFIGSPKELVSGHVKEILHRTITSYVDMLLSYPDLKGKVELLDPLQKWELQIFLKIYQANVPLDKLRTALEIVGNDIIFSEHKSDLMGFVPSIEIQNHDNISIQELELRLRSIAQLSPTDQLILFMKLISNAGIEAVYILIDGLDETSETVDDFGLASKLILPLLANLNLMNNTPHLAFKVFAPTEMKAALLDKNKIRRDRIDVLDIQLSDEDLSEILTRRLVNCSDDVVSSIDAVCTRDMRGKMESEILSKADGNPRRLILLGRYMINQRCKLIDTNDEQDFYLLTRNDLDHAYAHLPEELKLSNLDSSHEEVKKDQKVVAEEKSYSSYHIRQSLPAHLARAYVGYQHEASLQKRVWHLFDLVEACMAYLALIQIALLWENVGDETPRRIERARLHFKRTYLGRWLYSLNVLPGMCTSMQIKHPFAKKTQKLIQRFGEFLQRVVDQRNQIAHDGPQSDDLNHELINEFDEQLTTFLEAICSIHEGYYLVCPQKIVKREGKFVHQCKKYHGDTAVFPNIELMLNLALSCEHLWLIGREHVLNLHPFLIVESASDNLSEEIWLYQTVEEEFVSYKSYGTGRTIDLSEYLENIQKRLGV